MIATVPNPILPSSRKDARQLGIKTYHTGKSCKHGHVAFRYTSSGNCSGCLIDERPIYRDAQIAAKAKWRSENIEKLRADNLAYYYANRERMNTAAREWGRCNKERVVSKVAERRARDPQAWNAAQALHTRNRRARIRQSDGCHTVTDVCELLAIQKGKCANCRVRLGRRYHVDHVMPLALGGSNGRRNLQLLCAPCNLRKSALHPVAFAQREGKLL